MTTTQQVSPGLNRVTRSLVAASLSVLAVATAGCSGLTFAPSMDDALRTNLASMVTSAQDSLWWHRDALAVDPEGELLQIGFISDARPVYDDPTYEVGGGSYTLLGVSSSPEETSLTLATSGGAALGGGLFYQQRSAAVCFTLRIPVEEKSMHTEPSDCTDGQGHGLSDVADFERHGEPIPLDDLDVRLTVTEDDYQPLPCQCSSGGSCGCPGG